MTGHRVWPAILTQAGGIGIMAGVSFLLMILLARELGTEDFGRYVLILTVAGILFVPIEGGWPNEVYRRSAAGAVKAQAARAAVSYAVAHVLVVGVLLVVVSALVGLFFHPTLKVLAVALVCMTVVAAMNIVSFAMRGSGRFPLEALFQTIGRLVSAALIVLVLTMVADAWMGYYFLAWAAGLFLVLLPAIRPWLALPNFSGWRRNVRRVIPLMVFSGAMIALFKIDVIVLGALPVSDAALSNYAATTRFVEAGLLFFAAVSNVLLRQFTRQVVDPHRLLSQVQGWLLFAILAGSLIFLAAIGYGRELVLLSFGNAYTSAAEIVVYVSLVFPFAFANLVLIQGWIAIEEDSKLALRLCLAILLLSGFVVLGWTVFRLEGVAAGVAVAHLLLTLVLYAGLVKHVRPA